MSGTPSAQILEFLDTLPDTIRDSAREHLAFYFFGYAAGDDGADPGALVSKLLSRTDEVSGFAQALKVIGVLDHILSKKRRLSEDLQQFQFAHTSGIRHGEAALGLPLRERHLEEAHRSWLDLRAEGSPLGSQALHKYEATLSQSRDG